MSVYDALQGYMQLVEMDKKGALMRDRVGLAAKILVDLASSIITGLLVTSFFIGAFLGLLTFGITTFFIKKRLVPECIQTWLRRSKYGVEQNTVLGQPFRDMDEEQESLLSLLRGIVVTAEVSDSKIEREDGSALCDYGDAKILYSCRIAKVVKSIAISVSLPSDMVGIMDLDMGDNLAFVKEKITVIVNKEKENCLFFTNNMENDFHKEDDVDGSDKEKYIDSKGGKIIGRFLKIELDNGMVYEENLKNLDINNSVRVKNVDKSRIIFSFIKDVVVNENNNKQEFSITLSIKSVSQLFNERYRLFLKLPTK